mgnify:FL=1
MIDIGSLHIDQYSYKLVIAHFLDTWNNGIRYIWIELTKNGITFCKNYY